MLALRLTMFEHLIDITRIAELQGIERQDGSVRIGAGTTDVDIETSSEMAGTVPLLARATPLIGHFQIRNRGTIGGSIVHADPAAEYPAVALALDATLEVLGTAGAGRFLPGLLHRVVGHRDRRRRAADRHLVPGLVGPVRVRVEEVARRHGDFAIAGAALALEVDSGDTVVRCGIGLFGLARRRCGPRRSRPRSSGATSTRSTPRSSASWRQRPGRCAERPALARGVPPAGRCGDGDESVAIGDGGGVVVGEIQTTVNGVAAPLRWSRGARWPTSCARTAS